MSRIHDLSDTWHLVAVTNDELAVTMSEYNYMATGWVDDQEAVKEVTDAWEAKGIPSQFNEAAPRLMLDVQDDSPVLFWKGEDKVLGRLLDTWNQNPVGSCVGFGSTRTAQDLMLWEIASGESEEFPGTELCPEVTYGGSRVEVGGGRIRGDGSVGAWAAKWITDWGMVPRKKYSSVDLTKYNPDTCRQLGREGIPTELETLAKIHPVTAAAMVTTGEQTWAAIGGGKPVFVCSDQGFSMNLGGDGFCSPRGSWAHCMGIRGRFLHPRNGRSFVIGNSWADYLTGGSRTVEYVDPNDGKTKSFMLPIGCFCTTLNIVNRMVSQRDSFALAGFQGWKKVTVDYTP